MSKAAELAALIGSQSSLSNRNLIINGAMQVWQRATAATTAVNSSYQTVDRWIFYENTDGTYTTEQSTDTPNGTGYSLKAVVTGADTSIAASQYAAIEHYIEAQNCQHLLYGTSAAKHLTLSFWVKSSKTGTYTIALYKQDTTSYLYTKEYTINSADTWEKKEITISPTAGSTSFITTSGGQIDNNNGLGLSIGFNLAWGSDFTGGTSDSWSSDTTDYSTTNAVNWMDSTSNNFYLAEVQLEVGEQATPFEHRSYGDELARCQRYYAQLNGANGSTGGIGTAHGIDATSAQVDIFPPVIPMRATATGSLSGASTFTINTAAISAAASARTILSISDRHMRIDFTHTSDSNTTHGSRLVRFNSTSAFIAWDAEL